MKRPDHPLVPQDRHRRPHVDAFVDLTPIDESTLIERSQLLDAIADDDDIEWTIRSKFVPRVRTPKRQMKSLP